jgi:hypothetical protein
MDMRLFMQQVQWLGICDSFHNATEEHALSLGGRRRVGTCISEHTAAALLLLLKKLVCCAD